MGGNLNDPEYDYRDVVHELAEGRTMPSKKSGARSGKRVSSTDRKRAPRSTQNNHGPFATETVKGKRIMRKCHCWYTPGESPMHYFRLWVETCPIHHGPEDNRPTVRLNL